MNRPPDVDARLVAWLDEGTTTGPEDLLLSVFERTRLSHQDRVWLDPLTRPMRFRRMNTILKAAVVAVAVMAIGIGGLWTRTSHQAAVGGPSPSPTATPAPLRPGMTLPAGDYTVAPFGGTEGAPCGPTAQDPCADAAVDDAIRFTFTVPDGWAGAPGGNDIWLAGANNSGPEGAGFLLGRGGWLYSDPCSEDDVPADIPVGPTVDDFVDALVAHPMLELTDPVDVTIGGYAGKYLELQGPADRTDCQYFMAWPTFYAQGDSNHMPIWVLDANGVRVVIHGSEFPGTPPERSAELRAIVESLRISSPSPPAARGAALGRRLHRGAVRGNGRVTMWTR